MILGLYAISYWAVGAREAGVYHFYANSLEDAANQFANDVLGKTLDEVRSAMSGDVQFFVELLVDDDTAFKRGLISPKQTRLYGPM